MNKFLKFSVLLAVLSVFTFSSDSAFAAKSGKKKGGNKDKNNSGLAAVCPKISPIKLLVKPTAGGHITAGPRTTGYSVVCSRSQCIRGSKASFYYSNGNLAGQVGYYGTWVGNGQGRYYGGTAGAPQHFTSKITATARKLSDPKLYLNLNNGQCVAFNATGRNGSPF